MESSEELNSGPKPNAFAILMIGALSMLFGEVYAGSSRVWFLDPWGIFSTYILYLTHIVFYVNLAKRWNRTRLSHLYFFGALFALYEAPITQVLWSGYMDAVDPPNIFLGISIIEYIILVFFWHPVFSFMIPLMVYEIMVFDNSGRNAHSIFPAHSEIIMRISKKKKMLLGLLFLMTIFQVTNSRFDLFGALTAFIGSGLIIVILFTIAKSNKSKSVSIDSLIVSKGKFVFLIFFMIFYVYIGISLSVTALLPGRWPTEILPYIIIIFSAVLFIVLIRKSPPSIEKESMGSEQNFREENSSEMKMVGLKDVYSLFFLIIPIGCIVFASIPAITLILFIIGYFSFIIIAIVLLVKNLKGLK